MKAFTYFIFRFLVNLVGNLSDKNLYRLSKGVKVLIYNILGYRKKVTLSNLSRAFPNKSTEELKSISNQYYQNLSDIIIETFASYNWSLERMGEHFNFINIEILKPYLEKNQKILCVASHTGNFEIGAVLIPEQIKTPSYSVYKEFANPRLEHEIVSKRSRTGLHLATTKQIKPLIASMQEPGILFLIADQNPSVIQKAYWINFFNQDTAFVHGPANIAKEYNMPVFYADTKKIRKGYYESTISLITSDPSSHTHEEITALFAGKLEQSLRERPDNWLWSHKRWKWKRNQGEFIRIP